MACDSSCLLTKVRPFVLLSKPISEQKKLLLRPFIKVTFAKLPDQDFDSPDHQLIVGIELWHI